MVFFWKKDCQCSFSDILESYKSHSRKGISHCLIQNESQLECDCLEEDINSDTVCSGFSSKTWSPSSRDLRTETSNSKGLGCNPMHIYLKGSKLH